MAGIVSELDARRGIKNGLKQLKLDELPNNPTGRREALKLIAKHPEMRVKFLRRLITASDLLPAEVEAIRGLAGANASATPQQVVNRLFNVIETGELHERLLAHDRMVDAYGRVMRGFVRGKLTKLSNALEDKRGWKLGKRSQAPRHELITSFLTAAQEVMGRGARQQPPREAGPLRLVSGEHAAGRPLSPAEREAVLAEVKARFAPHSVQTINHVARGIDAMHGETNVPKEVKDLIGDSSVRKIDAHDVVRSAAKFIRHLSTSAIEAKGPNAEREISTLAKAVARSTSFSDYREALMDVVARSPRRAKRALDAHLPEGEVKLFERKGKELEPLEWKHLTAAHLLRSPLKIQAGEDEKPRELTGKEKDAIALYLTGQHAVRGAPNEAEEHLKLLIGQLAEGYQHDVETALKGMTAPKVVTRDDVAQAVADLVDAGYSEADARSEVKKALNRAQRAV